MMMKETFDITGMTCAACSARVQKAGRLLRETAGNIAEIAQQVGYSNASKFSAAFKKELGMTPFEYRKKCRAGQLPVEME